MKTYSEVVANDIIPLFRSLVAEEMKERGASQEKIASTMCVSQPAVSQYLRGIRVRKRMKNDEAILLIRNLIEKEGNIYKSDEFKEFCSLVIRKKLIPNTEHIDDWMKTI